MFGYFICPDEMRRRTRSNGPQRKWIKIQIESAISYISLTPQSKLPDRCKTIAEVKMFHEAAKRIIDLHSNQPQGQENEDTNFDTSTNSASIEDFELPNLFESSRENENFFSFQSFGSLENP
jgi:hypothetical protein